MEASCTSVQPAIKIQQRHLLKIEILFLRSLNFPFSVNALIFNGWCVINLQLVVTRNVLVFALCFDIYLEIVFIVSDPGGNVITIHSKKEWDDQHAKAKASNGVVSVLRLAATFPA